MNECGGAVIGESHENEHQIALILQTSLVRYSAVKTDDDDVEHVHANRSFVEEHFSREKN